MADVPRQQQPYTNMSPVVEYGPKQPAGENLVPKGPKAGKVGQAQLALQGLIGAK